MNDSTDQFTLIVERSSDWIERVSGRISLAPQQVGRLDNPSRLQYDFGLENAMLRCREHRPNPSSASQSESIVVIASETVDGINPESQSSLSMQRIRRFSKRSRSASRSFHQAASLFISRITQEVDHVGS